MRALPTFLVAALFPFVTPFPQWQRHNMQMQQQRPFSGGLTPPQPMSSQQSENFQKYLYTPSVPPPVASSIHHQQTSFNWNSNRQPAASQNYPSYPSQQQQPPQQQLMQSNQQQHQRKNQQRVLVDYPFTVEYVDRSNQRRDNSNPFRANHYEDQNLVDYPFTVEYVNTNNNPNSGGGGGYENRRGGQASLHSNPDSFQLTSQQQQHSQRNNNNKQFHQNSRPTGGGNDCRLIKCPGGYQ